MKVKYLNKNALLLFNLSNIRVFITNDEEGLFHIMGHDKFKIHVKINSDIDKNIEIDNELVLHHPIKLLY